MVDEQPGRRRGGISHQSSCSGDACSPSASSYSSRSGSSSNGATGSISYTQSSSGDGSGSNVANDEVVDSGYRGGNEYKEEEETRDLSVTTRATSPFPDHVLLSIDDLRRLHEEAKKEAVRAPLGSEGAPSADERVKVVGEERFLTTGEGTSVVPSTLVDLLPTHTRSPNHLSKSKDGSHLKSKNRKRPSEEGSEGLRCRLGGSRSRARYLVAPSSSEELARAMARVPELSFEELKLEFEQLRVLENRYAEALVFRARELEKAHVTMSAALKIAKDQMEGAIRERDELATALGVAVKNEGLANEAKNTALGREEAVRAQLGDAKTQLREVKEELATQKETMLGVRKTLKETKQELGKTRAKLSGAEKAIVDAKALRARELRKEKDAGIIRFLASPEGKDEIVAGQRASHKRGMRMGVRQAVRKFSALSPDVKYFEPNYFDEAKEFGPSEDSLHRNVGSSATGVTTPGSKVGIRTKKVAPP